MHIKKIDLPYLKHDNKMCTVLALPLIFFTLCMHHEDISDTLHSPSTVYIIMSL